MFVDRKKAKLVLDRLCQTYSKKEYPYNLPEAKPPQIRENIPRSIIWGSREHAMFLFTTCYWMRGGIQSSTAIRNLAEFYEKCPWIFLPENHSKFAEWQLAAVLGEFSLGFNSTEISSIWKSNLKLIKTKWAGDPRNIFKNISTYEDACFRIQNKNNRGFRGFQEKMVSMITYFYMDAGILDKWHFPIPVDFHALRTLFAHEIIIMEKSEANGNGFYTKPVLAEARSLFHDYCITHNVDPVFLCEAVWLYSGLMCNKHPGNISDVGGRHGRKTELTPVSRWNQAQTETYARTCAVCVIKKTCKWCVPSAEYYIGGKIILREPRDAPPQSFLFDVIT